MGNGQDDDSVAFEYAWDAACQSHSLSGVYVPGGRKYMLLPVTLSGPCNSNVTVHIDGELVAPEAPFEWECSHCYTWIAFDGVDGLVIQGSGSLDGRGAAWWREWFCFETRDILQDCLRKPTALDIGKSSNVLLRDLRFKNSPQMHIAIKHSTYVFVTNVTVHTPGYIPNTDGIHIQNSEHVYVSDCDIRTGDDCISIGDGTSDIYVEGIHCGPGHGISIGSLGKDGSEDHAENIHVRNVHFRGTTNGVRINTWQGGRGYVKNIIFEDIICHRVLNPITIDQFYSGHELLRILPSAVQIHNVTFSNIRGTSTSRKAIELACSLTQPCTDIILKDINLHWLWRWEAVSSCWNAQGLTNGNVQPIVPCLEFDETLP
ncbi:hypothetical protein MLD38_009395 [Melastoma candidum]|uniref:Uncharacterized protein n=1 Tax=Melastoma candidum TaxID=119954 RepID=A0ACB9RXD9_9MYRT|nr:hypothetical protein MLD38_009395 [Melastoma candidum]